MRIWDNPIEWAILDDIGVIESGPYEELYALWLAMIADTTIQGEVVETSGDVLFVAVLDRAR